MLNHLKCFLSASFEVNLTLINQILEENSIEVYEFYDGSVGNSFQDILKRKLRQVDFAIFIVTKDNKNIFYEIGVCEGIGKQALIVLDKNVDAPFYLENRLSLTANLEDREVLESAIHAFLDELPKKRLSNQPNNKSQLNNNDSRAIFKSLIEQTIRLRINGQAYEFEYIVEEIFKTLRMKYAHNSNSKDIGIDFAIWNDKLGRVLGNPIIVELKFGNLTNSSFDGAMHQLRIYSEKSESAVALLFYLDKGGKRFRLKPTLKPLIIAFDLEDFLKNLLAHNFEDIIMTERNKIAHRF